MTDFGSTLRRPAGGGWRAWGLPAVGLVLLALSAGGQAQLPPDAAAYKGWQVASLEVRGLPGELTGDLRKGLLLTGRFKLYRTVRPRLYPRMLEEDLRRTRLFLARHGYPWAQVSARLTPASPTAHRIGVEFVVRPGAAVLIDSTTVRGLPAGWRPPRRPWAPGLQPGTRFAEAPLQSSAAALEQMLKQAGYALAEVRGQVDRRDSTRVRVTLEATPGALYRFSGTRISGTRSDLVPLVQKTTRIEPGLPFSPERIQRAHEDLRLLQLFRQIRLRTADVGPGLLELQVELLDRTPRTLELGIGYWSDEFLRARARWEHRNLLRGGRGVELMASGSRFLQELTAATWWPAFFGSRTHAVLRLGAERQDEESYELRSAQVELAARVRPAWHTTWRVGLALSKVEVDVSTSAVEAFTEEGGLLGSISLHWVRDGADDRLSPTRGTVTSLVAEWAPPLIAEAPFASLEASEVGYLPLSGSFVLAGRAAAGLARAYGGAADLLPNKRFYAGGVRSMRGFGRRRLGPLDDEGAPLGGEARVELTLEARFPIAGRLRGALFCDAGQVWPTRSAARWGTLEAAIGPGLMVQTPVGPVRADWGYRLTRHERSQPRSAFHISIGHPF